MLNAFAGQRFVAVTGRDTSKGTFDQPWRTIQHAANSLLPNDTVFIRGGTYAEQVVVNVSGTNESAYISFMPFAREEVVLSGAAANSPDMFTIESQSYIRVIGLKFRDLRIPDSTDVNKGGSAIRVTGSSHNITLARNTISNISGVLPQGIAVYGYDAAAPVRNIRIVGNTIHSFLTDTVNGSYGGSGVRISGACDSILIRLNTIHDMRAVYDSLGGAMAITVYGANAGFPSRRILIDGNTVYDCEASRSEAITLSGNVEDFFVLYNVVYQINNIGIATGGGYFVCPDSALDFPRRGQIKWNRVYSCHTRLEDGYAAGIYIDGSRNIIVEGNISSSNDVGIGVNAEQVGRVCDSVIVRSNFMWGNDRSGLAFGGFGIGVKGTGQLDTSGIVRACLFLNNTTFANNVRGVGQGELAIEDSTFDCEVRGNIFYARDDTLLLSTSNIVSQNIQLDYNLWFTPAGAATSVFRMNGYEGPDITSFAAYRTATGMDANSLFTSPLFVDSNRTTPNLHLRATSPAINVGDPNYITSLNELDIDEEPRIIRQRIDIGADEVLSTNVVQRESSQEEFTLYQNYPNPFNPSTTIRFSLPHSTDVSLQIFNILGQEVATLPQGKLEAGVHTRVWQADEMPSGVYVYRVRTPAFVLSRKMLLVR